jgi:hypothetical protein
MRAGVALEHEDTTLTSRCFYDTGTCTVTGTLNIQALRGSFCRLLTLCYDDRDDQTVPCSAYVTRGYSTRMLQEAGILRYVCLFNKKVRSLYLLLTLTYDIVSRENACYL